MCFTNVLGIPLCMCICVYMCVKMHTDMQVHMCIHLGGSQRIISSVVLQEAIHIDYLLSWGGVCLYYRLSLCLSVLRQGLSLLPKLTNLTRLAGQGALGIHLSLPPR